MGFIPLILPSIDKGDVRANVGNGQSDSVSMCGHDEASCIRPFPAYEHPKVNECRSIELGTDKFVSKPADSTVQQCDVK